MRKDDAFQNIMRRFLKGDENMVNDVMWAAAAPFRVRREMQLYHYTDRIYPVGPCLL